MPALAAATGTPHIAAQRGFQTRTEPFMEMSGFFNPAASKIHE